MIQMKGEGYKDSFCWRKPWYPATGARGGSDPDQLSVTLMKLSHNRNGDLMYLL